MAIWSVRERPRFSGLWQVRILVQENREVIRREVIREAIVLSFVQAGQPSDTVGCQHASKATDYLRAFSEEKREQAASSRSERTDDEALSVGPSFQR
jgi:hypothetical protein